MDVWDNRTFFVIAVSNRTVFTPVYIHSNNVGNHTLFQNILEVVEVKILSATEFTLSIGTDRP